MGDISEMRALIVLFTLIAIVVGLIIAIPSEFFSSNLENSGQPDINLLNVFAWNSTLAVNMTSYDSVIGTEYFFEASGYNFVLTQYATNSLSLATYAQWWIFHWDLETFTWFDTSNNLKSETSPLGVDIIYSSVIDEYSPPQSFTLMNSKTQLKVTLTYNTTAYSSFTDAMENSDCALVTNIDWDDRDTSMNALELVGLVLTASIPDIHPALNTIFALIAWSIIAAGAYLLFIFVLRIVGAVFGGGGA